MPQTQLTILVVLSDCIDTTLSAQEKAKALPTANSTNVNLVAEGHRDRVADLLAVHGKRPGKRLTCLTGCESQITARSEAAHLQALLGEESETGRLMNISVMSKT